MNLGKQFSEKGFCV